MELNSRSSKTRQKQRDREAEGEEIDKRREGERDSSDLLLSHSFWPQKLKVIWHVMGSRTLKILNKGACLEILEVRFLNRFKDV
ncbi:hypothetical protein L2E82_37647 [Cichorium intybus]|uniref:Uncharacterized protein n=1 Tax=Cichorium intybus TaxID=13427 RepID=A0ACB9AF30_CICIN|nr:hypothetical protein L2E82_37647 [Cichorium intybus]